MYLETLCKLQLFGLALETRAGRPAHLFGRHTGILFSPEGSMHQIAVP